MSTSISGAIAGRGTWLKRIDQINTYWWNHNLCFSRLTLVCLCSYLILGIAGLVVIHQIFIKQNQINQEEAQHQFLKLWLTRLYVNSWLQALSTSALDQHLKPTTLSLSSSQASSTWCKLPHSAKSHMKMLVLIFRISWRLAAQSPSRTLLKISYYSACFHSH